MGLETTGLEQLFETYSMDILIPTFIGLIIGFAFIAFFGYRFLKIEIILSAIFTGYDFGSRTLGLAVGDAVSGVDLGIILGIACAVVFALLSIKIYKWYIYFIGGLFGAIFVFAIGVSVGAALGSETVGLIVGIILAVLIFVPAAKLFYKIFKPFYIILTSVVGMVFSAIYVALLVFGIDESALSAAMLIGLALSIPAMIFQFRINRGRSFDDN